MKRTPERSYIMPSVVKIERKRGSQSFLYKLSFWVELSRNKLRKNPLCETCEKYGMTKTAHEVDHITPVPRMATKQQFMESSNWDNLQSLCREHHARKSRYENNQ